MLFPYMTPKCQSQNLPLGGSLTPISTTKQHFVRISSQTLFVCLFYLPRPKALQGLVKDLYGNENIRI